MNGTLLGIILGISIGYLLMQVLVFVIWLLHFILLFIIEWRNDYIYLKKRNNHRKKCGLNPITK